MKPVDETTSRNSARCAEAGPDPTALAARTEMISHLLQAHGGGIELVDNDTPDIVRVRFTGLCTNCCLRPLTVANIVRPVFTDLEGVRDVEVEGSRISTEAMESLRRDLASSPAD